MAVETPGYAQLTPGTVCPTCGQVVPKQRFYDTDSGRWLIFNSDETPAGQAYFFVNPLAKRDVVIEALHEPIDAGTGLEAARVFMDVAGRVLLVNGAHRCSSDVATPCDGTTTACGGGDRAYPISDIAHETRCR